MLALGEVAKIAEKSVFSGDGGLREDTRVLLRRFRFPVSLTVLFVVSSDVLGIWRAWTTIQKVGTFGQRLVL